MSAKIEDYSAGKKRRILIVFDDMIADMINNKRLVTELFIRGRKFILKCQTWLD